MSGCFRSLTPLCSNLVRAVAACTPAHSFSLSCVARRVTALDGPASHHQWHHFGPETALRGRQEAGLVTWRCARCADFAAKFTMSTRAFASPLHE